ncbi:MAG: hypothetical protein AB1393_14135 [Candidatus Edwardsbacteria bacterium]
MPTIIISTLNKLTFCDPDRDSGAKIGRWCGPKYVPDRCDNCWDPKTLAHYEAEFYYEEKAPDGTIWRVGACHRCKDKIKHKLIPCKNQEAN